MNKFVLTLVLILSPAFFKVALADSLRNPRCSTASTKTVWRAEASELQVDISSLFDSSLGACIRRLSIKNPALPSGKQAIYTEMMAEVPVAIWPVNSRLLIAWESGSAHWLTVYDIKSKGVQKVLDLRTKGLPEITYQSSGMERLSFPRYSNENGKYAKDGSTKLQIADIYTWQGDKYEEVKNLPFVNRFDER